MAVQRGLPPVDVAHIARHMSLHSQAIYVKTTTKRKMQRDAAMLPEGSKKVDHRPTPDNKQDNILEMKLSFDCEIRIFENIVVFPSYA